MKEFNFKFTLITINATIDESNTLTIKQGLKTWKTEISRLRHLYVLTLPDTGYELMLTFDDDSGKLRKIRCNSNFGQPDFESLVNELVKLRPDIDIRTKGVGEAHKLMGAFNMMKIAPVVVFFLVMAVMTVLFLPGLIHGLNPVEQTISILDLEKPGAVKGNILSVTDAYPYLEGYLEVKTKDDSSTTTENFVAIVPDKFSPEDPVHLILKTKELTDAEWQELAASPTVKGVLRNILFEGLSGENKTDFTSKVFLKLADDVLLLEYRADVQADMITAFIILGASAVILLIACVIVAKRMPK